MQVALPILALALCDGHYDALDVVFSTEGSLQWWHTGSADFAIGLDSVDSTAVQEDLAGFSFNRNAEDEDMHVLLLARWAAWMQPPDLSSAPG